jgi:hypothetical protein
VRPAVIQRNVLVDLTNVLDTARRQPGAASFAIAPVALQGPPVRSIVAASQTRLTFHVTVPSASYFRVLAGIHPDSWNDARAAQVFLVGVSDGRAYRQAASIVVDPASHPTDRQWREIRVDLRQYVGLTIDIVLNTRLAAGAPEPDVPHAVWGSPQVVSR